MLLMPIKTASSPINTNANQQAGSTELCSDLSRRLLVSSPLLFRPLRFSSWSSPSLGNSRLISTDLDTSRHISTHLDTSRIHLGQSSARVLLVTFQPTVSAQVPKLSLSTLGRPFARWARKLNGSRHARHPVLSPAAHHSRRPATSAALCSRRASAVRRPIGDAQRVSARIVSAESRCPRRLSACAIARPADGSGAERWCEKLWRSSQGQK